MLDTSKGLYGLANTPYENEPRQNNQQAADAALHGGGANRNGTEKKKDLIGFFPGMMKDKPGLKHHIIFDMNREICLTGQWIKLLN